MDELQSAEEVTRLPEQRGCHVPGPQLRRRPGCNKPLGEREVPAGFSGRDTPLPHCCSSSPPPKGGGERARFASGLPCLRAALSRLTRRRWVGYRLLLRGSCQNSEGFWFCFLRKLKIVLPPNGLSWMDAGGREPVGLQPWFLPENDYYLNEKNSPFSVNNVCAVLLFILKLIYGA